MTEIKLWWYRWFKRLSIKEAQRIGLVFHRNVYGDEINYSGCRSIWKDRAGRFYRITELL
jgi:hypothetical protein